MKEKVYCCRYAHCKFADKKLPANKMILSKGLYYHRECFAERENINKIIKLYIEIIDPSVNSRVVYISFFCLYLDFKISKILLDELLILIDVFCWVFVGIWVDIKLFKYTNI